MKTIYNIITNQERLLTSGSPIKIGKYATHNHLEKIATIQAYLNSQHISGERDSKGREKPFFNIVTQAVNVWYKATDIDRKDIRFRPTKASKRLKSFIATLLFRRWMIENKFGIWLNNWGYTLAGFGSAVSKFVEKGNKLIPSVISWDKIICDPVDFYSAPVIEKIYYTPDELLNTDYDQKAVKKILDKLTSSKNRRTTLNGEPIDMSSQYIGVYELHGNLPLYYLTGRERDKEIYQQQMHVVYINQGKYNSKGDFITLYKGKEEKNPYFISHLIKQDGRTLSIGAVEYLLDAQWMVNHSMKQAKDQLDLASKTLLQTSDSQFTGRNATLDIDVGDILVTDDNKPLVPVNTQATAVPFLINFMKQWYDIGKDITGANDAITGNTMPAGTPYRLGAIMNIESHNLFEIMKENKGLYLEQMIRKYVLPYFKKRLRTTDEIVVDLEGEEIEQFDTFALPAQLALELKERLGKEDMPSLDELISAVQQKNALMGKKRALVPGEGQTWIDYFRDLDLDAIEVNITGESRNKAEAYSILNGLLQLMIQNPTALDNPNIRKILGQIMDEAGYVAPFQFMEGTTIGTQATSPSIGRTVPSTAQLSPISSQQEVTPGVGVLPKR